MKQRILLLASLLISAGLLFAGTASADSPVEPYDYTLVTENGQYIFVMLSHNASGGYNQTGFTWPDADISGKYSEAGLYKNDGSTTPLWTIDWYSFDIELSSDGQHLVQYGPWAGSNAYDELAVAFYEEGRMLAHYSIQQLVRDPATLPHSVSHFEWLRDSTFDDTKGELRIETYNGESYTFNVKTGHVVHGTLVASNLALPDPGLIVGFTTLILFALVVLLLRRRIIDHEASVNDAARIGGNDGLC